MQSSRVKSAFEVASTFYFDEMRNVKTKWSGYEVL